MHIPVLAKPSVLSARFLGLRAVAWACVTLVASPAPAAIDVDGQQHEERDGYRDDFRFNRQSISDLAVRMGMATFANRPYYAFVGPSGNSIRIAPGDDNARELPSLDGNIAVEARLPAADAGRVYVVDLIPRDGLLYLVYRSDTGGVYIQAFKSQDLSSLKLVAVGDMKSIAAQGGAPAAIGAVNGDEGISVLGLWKQSDGGNLKFVSFRLRGSAADFERITTSSATGLGEGTAAEQVNAADAVATHEFNADGELEEIHYLVWADKSNRIRQIRYRPPLGDEGDFGFEARDTGLTKNAGANAGSVLTLVEGGMKGDASTESGLSLVEFVADAGLGKVNQLRHVSISSSQHGPVGTWSEVGMKFEGDGDTTHRFAPASITVHWGVDKYRVDAGPATKGPAGTTFQQNFQQWFRFGVVTFQYVYRGSFRPDDKYTSFHTGLVAGNRFVTDATPGNPDGTSLLDTQQALDGGDSLPLVRAWTLVGVVHGLPPYIPFTLGQKYPTLKFTYNTTSTESLSITDSTEDSKEVSVVASLGGGEISRGGGAKGVLSVEASYSYAFKSVDGITTTSTTTRSQTTSETFEPDNRSTPYPPDELGVLFYSVPLLVSKGYRMRRWNGDAFTDSARNVYVTVVAKRQLLTLYYLLDKPELGPLMGTALTPDANYKALTEGIDPVPRTGDLKKWRTSPVRDFADYQQFRDRLDGATFDSSTASAGNFALSYTQTDTQSKVHSETKTHKGSVKISGGLKGIFNIAVTGSLTHANTFSTTTTSTTSVGTGISGEYPKLWRDPEKPTAQPVTSISTNAVLLYAQGDKTPSWTPTALRGSSPFLLTWTVNSVRPAEYGRKPWKMPGFGARN